MANSSMTFAYDDARDGDGQPAGVRRVQIDWLSDDAAGTVSGTTRRIAGKLVRAVTVPSGSAAPTNLYDVTLTDQDGADVLGNCISTLANRSSTLTENVELCLSDGAGTPAKLAEFPTVCGPLTVAVANAGNAKAGKLVLYYWPLP